MGQKLSNFGGENIKPNNTATLDAIFNTAVKLVESKWNESMNYIPDKLPVLHDCGGDISKRWYVRYWYFSPKQQKVVSNKVREVKGFLAPNRIKAKTKRYEQFALIRKALERMVLTGWTPEDEYNPTFVDEVILGRKKPTLSLADAFNQAYTINSRLKQKGDDLLVWLQSQYIDTTKAGSIKRKHIADYLRHVQLTKGLDGGPASNSTYNNYRGDLHTLFEIVVTQLDDDIMLKNPVAGIERKKYSADRHRPYTLTQMTAIMQWCTQNDPYLKDYLLFIGYSFLRTIEILRLQVRDVDLEKRLISVPSKKTKTAQRAQVLIIERLFPILQKIINQSDSDSDYLFTTAQKPGPERINKTTHFSDRFRKGRNWLNKHLGQEFTKDHTMYGTRHTFAGDVYKTMRQSMTKAEAIYKLSLLMRHSSPDMTDKYIRDQGFELPEDYSDLYSLSFEK